MGTGLSAAPMLMANSNSTPGNSTAYLKDQPAHRNRKLGPLEVSSICLGGMSMTSGHYNPPRNFKQMEPVLRGAVHKGVTFFDTAEYYGPFNNEGLVGKALKPEG